MAGVRVGVRAFAALGTAVGFADKYASGRRGEGFDWTDTGPQGAFKAAGRVAHTQAGERARQERLADEMHTLKLKRETPAFTTNLPTPLPNLNAFK